MSLVVLTRDPDAGARHVAGATCGAARVAGPLVVVYSRRSTAPSMLEAVEAACGAHLSHSVAFEDYGDVEHRARMAALPADQLGLVVLDLHAMVGNRLDKRLDAIQFRQRAALRIDVEPHPYVERPWRVYFPYSLVDRRLLGYNHSYAIEREWDKWRFGERADDPCAVEVVAPATRAVTRADETATFGFDLDVTVEPVPGLVREGYEAEKARLLKTAKNIRQVFAGLDAYLQSWCPWRRVPLDLRPLYQAGGPGPVVATDLGLDRFLVREMRYVYRHHNDLVASLAGALAA